MREPLGGVIRHATDAGLGNWQVPLEILRMAVVLLLVARLFLSAGLYFEVVYMQPDSSALYPRRSYPTDFLAGLAQFMIGASATTVIGTHARLGRIFAPYTIIVYLFLIVDVAWLAVARARGLSSVSRIQALASRNLFILCAAAIIQAVSLATGADPVFADQAALGAVALGATIEIFNQIRIYESLDR